MAAAHQRHDVSRRTETPSDDRLMSVTELAEHFGGVLCAISDGNQQPDWSLPAREAARPDGLVAGIDTADPTGALEHQHGRTIAVIGTGITRTYARQARRSSHYGTT